MLGNYLKEAGLTEGRRTGVPRIFSSMEANESDKPTFLMDGERESLTVHLPIQKQFLDGSSGVEMQFVKQDDDLKSKILMALSAGPLSRREIAVSLGYKGISARFAAMIVKMEEEGLIQSFGNDGPRSIGWRLDVDKNLTFLHRQIQFLHCHCLVTMWRCKHLKFPFIFSKHRKND